MLEYFAAMFGVLVVVALFHLSTSMASIARSMAEIAAGRDRAAGG